MKTKIITFTFLFTGIFLLSCKKKDESKPAEPTAEQILEQTTAATKAMLLGKTAILFCRSIPTKQNSGIIIYDRGMLQRLDSMFIDVNLNYKDISSQYSLPPNDTIREPFKYKLLTGSRTVLEGKLTIKGDSLFFDLGGKYKVANDPSNYSYLYNPSKNQNKAFHTTFNGSDYFYSVAIR